MVRDVYAADDKEPDPREGLAVITFFVSAEPEPLVVSRIGNQLALSNLVPSFLQMTAVDDLHVRFEATLAGVTPEKAELIRRKLLQLSCVFDVVLGEPRTPPSNHAVDPP